MVKSTNNHTRKTSIRQGSDKPLFPSPLKIGASTPYDFQGSNRTAYGGLLPVATMLEKLQFQQRKSLNASYDSARPTVESGSSQ